MVSILSLSLVRRYTRDLGSEYMMPWVRYWSRDWVSICYMRRVVSYSERYLISGLLLDRQLNTLLQIMLRLFSANGRNGSSTY